MSILMTRARNRAPRIAGAAVERARLTVVPRRAPKVARVPFVSLVSLLLIAGVAGLLLFNTSMQQASFTATALEDRASLLDAKEQSLKMELDVLRDPQKVAARAKQLGLVPTTSPAFLRLADGKVLGSPAVAVATRSMRLSPLPTRKPRSLTPRAVVLDSTDRMRDTASASQALGLAEGTKKNRDR